MDPNDRLAIEEFKGELKRIYGPRLREIILYGSHARGHATADSDIDLAVVLDEVSRPGEEIDRMIDAIDDILLDRGVLISVLPVSEADYRHRRSPLLMNIRREGVPA